jgi:hypothetical protein
MEGGPTHYRVKRDIALNISGTIIECRGKRRQERREDREQ